MYNSIHEQRTVKFTEFGFHIRSKSFRIFKCEIQIISLTIDCNKNVILF